jgi:aspartyl-tRNA(Asn)/glutamyl-tRNA(Gln) amidotransferase subunit A
MKPPRLIGRALSAARLAAERPGSRALVQAVARRSLNIDALAALPEALRGLLPSHQRPIQAAPPRRWLDAAPSPLSRPPWPHAAGAYVEAYRAGALTPRVVAERALAALDALAARSPKMNIDISRAAEATLRDADAASARYAAGAPRGSLDGVPFLVKDEFDVKDLVTTLGAHPALARTVATRDATAVARLRAAGAVFVCKTVLTEFGMSPLGANIHQAMPHNPHHPDRAAGGSSTGSAVGVALGVSPLALGGDGGGSIRIPSALCGVFGLKPTFGRVSRAGDGFKGTVSHAGPIAASVWDLALFLDAAGSAPDPEDDLTGWAPPPPMGGFRTRLGAGVRGLRVGVPESEWRAASPAVAQVAGEALATLEREGAILVDVRLSLAEYAAAIGYLTIGPESLASNARVWREEPELLSEDLRFTYAVLSSITGLEHLDGQRLRAGLRAEVASVLRGVDVLALPTTVTTAPRYAASEAGRPFSDIVAVDGLCRFAFLGNLTGLPAGTAPVGVDVEGLPIGLQIIGDAWDEASVLAVLAHLERTEVARVRRPPGAVDLLG